MAIKTLRLASGASEALSGVKIHIRELQKDDHALSGYFSDLAAGRYSLALLAKFHKSNDSTWAGILRTDPVVITITK